MKGVLLDNCGTWGVSKDDQRKLNSFHRKQLRKGIGIQCPHKISNNKLYKITVDHHNREEMAVARTHSETVSRLSCKKDDQVLFKGRTNKMFRGRGRNTILSTLNEGIK